MTRAELDRQLDRILLEANSYPVTPEKLKAGAQQTLETIAAYRKSHGRLPDVERPFFALKEAAAWSVLGDAAKVVEVLEPEREELTASHDWTEGGWGSDVEVSGYLAACGADVTARAAALRLGVEKLGLDSYRVHRAFAEEALAQKDLARARHACDEAWARMDVLGREPERQRPRVEGLLLSARIAAAADGRREAYEALVEAGGYNKVGGRLLLDVEDALASAPELASLEQPAVLKALSGRLRADQLDALAPPVVKPPAPTAPMPPPPPGEKKRIIKARAGSEAITQTGVPAVSRSRVLKAPANAKPTTAPRARTTTRGKSGNRRP
ncbi:MAG: hypothetical protein ACOZQL_30505 [Myxococcota bacterium]